jgi:hypothetical protein
LEAVFGWCQWCSQLQKPHPGNASVCWIVKPVIYHSRLCVLELRMLTDSQKLVLKQIAVRRIKEGGRCYFETRAQFYQLMMAALSMNHDLTQEQFLKDASEELAKYVRK